MSSKRCKTAESNLQIKKRKVMTLIEKVKILDKLKNGASAASVASEFGVNESTIRYIKKAEEKIRNSIDAAAESTLKVACVSRRDPFLEKMEKMLNIWIEDQNQKSAPLSGLIIRSKASHIYESLKHSEAEATTSTESEKPFQASRGWFENFKKRFNLHNLKLAGEAASADHEAAKRYPAELAAHIATKGYLPDQVFNADETGLFWKKMPSRTFISRDQRTAPGFKAAKDRLTLLFCANASGDFKCKPMLVYRALNPRALKGKNRSEFPVFWRANKRAWVTSTLFEDWFYNCFVVEVRKYLERKNVAFKVLLLVDNAPGHPQTLAKEPNVEVMFLPPNTTSLLQPMDQGIIATFKSYYTRRSFSHILQALEKDPALSVKDCWSRYNILTAVETIGASWEEVQGSTLNACWRKLWPDIVEKSATVPDKRKEMEKAVEIAHLVGKEGFDQIELHDVEDLIDEHNTGLTTEELSQMVEPEEVHVSSDEEDVIIKPSLTTKVLAEVMDRVSQLKSYITEIDPELERSLLISRRIDEAILPYRHINDELRKKQRQQSIKDFFKPAEPQAGSSSSKN